MTIRYIGPGVGSNVQTAEIDDLAITTAKINAGAVTTAKIANDAVDKDKLAILTTKGDVLGYSSEPARLPVGTNDQVLTADSAQATGTKWAAGGGGGTTSYWELVENKEVTGSAIQTHDSPAVAGDTDTAYIVEGRMVNDTGSTAIYSMRLNAATWAINRQYYEAANTSFGASRDTSTDFMALAAGDTGAFRCHFPGMKSGDERHFLTFGSPGNAANRKSFNTVGMITTPANGTEITGIGIGADIASGIGIGSFIRVWKMVA